MDGIMMEEGSSGTAARGIAGQEMTEQTDRCDQTGHGSGGGAGVARSAEGRLCTGKSGMSVATLAREGHVLRMDGLPAARTSPWKRNPNFRSLRVQRDRDDGGGIKARPSRRLSVVDRQ